MTAELWIGPAASGRTTACIRHIQEIKQRTPLAPVMVILPDLRQEAAFRRRLALAGGALAVEAGTFGNFYREVLRTSGQHVRVAPEPVQLRVLRVCIDRALGQGALPYYQPIARTPGFLKVLYDRFGELQRSGLSPDGFSRFASSREPALQEMARLYNLYREAMQELGWEDRYSLNQRALVVIRDHPEALDFLEEVIVDGFDSFNLSQAEALALIARTRNLVVTLPGSVDMDRAVFQRFRTSMELLQSRIEGLQVSMISAQTRLGGPLAALERSLFEEDAGRFRGGPAVQMVETRSAVEEARQALRWIKARNVRDGVPLYECALVVPDVERYRPLLVEAAAEFGIPLRFTQGEQLLDAPPIAALVDLLRLPLSNWRRQLVVSCLHSPYLDFTQDGFDPQSSDLQDADNQASVHRLSSQDAADLQALRSPDASSPDAGRPDARSQDADDLQALRSPDAGSPDAGRPDADNQASVHRLSSQDAADLQAPGSPDASSPDARSQDAGRPDADRRFSNRRLASRSDADRLDDVSLYGQVIEGLDQWREALERLSGVQDSLPDAADDEQLRNLPGGEEAERLLRSLEALAQQLDCSETHTTLGWVTWLEDLLDHYQFFDRCQEGADKAAVLALRELLRSLVLAEQVAGSREETCAEFVAELQSVLEASGFQEESGRKSPAVQVLTSLEARGVRFTAAAVMGLAEGVFPGVEREDPFLSEEVRLELGLEPRLERAQEGLFYQAVTRADRFLLLTRPTLAEGGETWEPSPYWEAVSCLLEEDPQEAMPGVPRQLEEAASEGEFLFRAVQQRSLPGSQKERFAGRWEQLRSAARILAARQAGLPEGVHEGGLATAAGELGAAFGPTHTWSASRLEQYARCPFQFFAGTLMRLETRDPPVPGLDAARLGSLLHAVLEEAYRQAEDPADPASVLQVLPQVAAEAFAEAPQIYGFRPTAYWEIEKAGYYAILAGVIEKMGEHQGDGGWQPYAFEAAFGLKGAPPLQVEEGGEVFRFRGLIDRVDRREGGEVCVIDYKTGSSHLGKKDYIDGWRLQLPLYALAAESLGLGKAVDGMYWALKANEPGKPSLSEFAVEVDGRELRGLDGVVELAKQHVGRIVRAVREGRFQPEPPDEGCPTFCPAGGWCWRYKPGRYG